MKWYWIVAWSIYVILWITVLISAITAIVLDAIISRLPKLAAALKWAVTEKIISIDRNKGA